MNEFQTGNFVVGARQMQKALECGKVKKVYIASDADIFITDSLIQACIQRDVDVDFVPSRRELGKLCRIDVGAAAAAILDVH